MASGMQGKLKVLNMIYAERANLFGKRSKIRSWNAVAQKAKEVFVIDQHQDGKYLRDITWKNWMNRFLAKRDKTKKTGENGGRNSGFDEADDLIYKIIGKDSPVLDGLNVPESSGTSSADIKFHPVDLGGNEDSDTSESEVVKRKKPGVKKGRAQALDRLNDLKRQLLEKQLELLKQQKRIRELDVFKLEKELGLSPSEFTRNLHQQQGTDNKPNGLGHH